MAYPAASGGSNEALTNGATFLHFRAMSNELHSPKVLRCPSDNARPARSFGVAFSNENVSYFVGVDARDTNPNMLLSGDRNVTDGMPPTNNIIVLTTNRPANWTRAIHNRCGNVTLADGSVHRYNTADLTNAVAHTGYTENRIQLP